MLLAVDFTLTHRKIGLNSAHRFYRFLCVLYLSNATMCLTTLFEAANVIFYNVPSGSLLRLVSPNVRNLAQTISAIKISLISKQIPVKILTKQPLKFEKVERKR
jgi:hypothetical protein